jgi:hypothetical protein
MWAIIGLEQLGRIYLCLVFQSVSFIRQCLVNMSIPVPKMGPPLMGPKYKMAILSKMAPKNVD